MELSEKNILIISPQPWNVSMNARQFYARELAKKGNKVFFLQPPTKLNSVIEKSENLFIVDYKSHKPLLGFLQGSSESVELKKILQLIARPLDLVWTFDATRFGDLSKFGAKYKVYYLEEWEDYAPLESKLVQSADFVITVSDALLKRLPEKTKATKLVFNHSLNHTFIDALKKVDYIRSNTQFATGRIRCGYIGNFQNKYIDTVHFQQIIQENPLVEFHLIGPFVKDSNLAVKGNKTWEDPFVEFLMSAANVRMYGSLMTVRLAEIMQTMDLFLLCYDSETYAKEVANPHKLIEYLSTGKTVVSSYTEFYDNENRRLIQMANRSEDIPALFKAACKNLDELNSADLSQERINYALNHSYEKQLLRLEKVLSEKT